VRLLTPSCDSAATRRALDTLGEGFREDPLLPMLGVAPWRESRFFRLFSIFLDKWSQQRVLYVAGGGDAMAIVADSKLYKVRLAPGPWPLPCAGRLRALSQPGRGCGNESDPGHGFLS
jgi:hypothetical protein